jgi:hypothetical protein
MLVPRHQHGGAGCFNVIAPVILCGIAACLWWIVEGALGVFGPDATRLTIVRDCLAAKCVGRSNSEPVVLRRGIAEASEGDASALYLRTSGVIFAGWSAGRPSSVRVGSAPCQAPRPRLHCP